MELEAKLFAVELSHPYTNEAGRTWMVNEQRHMFCATAERAIELAHEAHPDAVIHVVRSVGARKPVLIDPVLLARAVSGEVVE